MHEFPTKSTKLSLSLWREDQIRAEKIGEKESETRRWPEKEGSGEKLHVFL